MSSSKPKTITPNTQTTASLTVQESDLASALRLSSADAYPAVFATSRMLALMEIAAARAITPLLTPEQLSVGASVDELSHSAATPVGSTVTATATFTGMEGKLFCFEVEARDEGGIIGKAKHRRAVVERVRLETAALRRVEGKL